MNFDSGSVPPRAGVRGAVRARTESSPATAIAWSSCLEKESMLLLAMLSSVAFAVVPPSNGARRHRPVAFATMIPTLQNAQSSPNAEFQCGGVDGEPFRDTLAGGSSVRLRIFNDARVDSDTLDRAMKRLTAIYAQIRVRLRWTTTDPLTDDGMPLFDIVITNSAPVQLETTNSSARAVDGVAGSAFISAHRAYAF